MNPDRDDPLIDALLAESLGGQTPPDLSVRILQAWAQQRNGASSPKKTSCELPPPATSPIPVGTPVATTPLIVSTPRRKRSVTGWMVTAVSVAAAVVVGAFVIRQQMKDHAVVIRPNDPPHKSPQEKSPANAPNSAIVQQPNLVVPKPQPNDLPAPQPAENSPGIAQKPAPSPAETKKSPPETSPSIPKSVNENQLVQAIPTRQPATSREVIQFINTQFTAAWKENGVAPALPASDSEWCRRSFLRLLGRIPTVDEAKAFTADRSADRRAKLVDSLTSSELYREEFSRHWGTVWTNILIGRTTGTSSGEAVSREGLQQYLTSAFQKNLPFDQIIAELLTAEGAAKPGTPDFNGAVNFLLAGFDADATVATTRVSRLFLGLNLQCAQCHNHPTNEWDQRDYWSLNAFLRQIGVDKREGRLFNRDLVVKKGDPTEAEVYYQTPSGIMKVAYPRFIDGTEIPRSGQLSEVNRRAKLAEFVTRSPQMPRALANRVWSQFFGYGFTQPVDDIGRGNQPSQPEVLDRLAEEFAAHNYNVRSLMQWIVLSNPFELSSKMSPSGLADVPEAGSTPLFSRYYTRQMQMEEVFDSLQIATRMRKKSGSNGNGETILARQDWLAQFSRPMATDDAAEESTFDGSVKQSLIMMNGEMMQRMTNPEHDGFLRSVIQGPLTFAQKVEHLFLAALTRVPTPKEKTAAQQLLAANQGKEANALSDLWWALLNSNEFIMDH